MATMLKDLIIIFNRTAQGSRSASLSWCTFVALAARCIQSLFYNQDDAANRRSKFDLLLQVYVDDPLATVRGNRKQRDRLAAVLMTGWKILGLPMAFHKAQRGITIPWIGVVLSINMKLEHMTAEVTAEKLEEIRILTDAYLKVNVIGRKKNKDLRQ